MIHSLMTTCQVSDFKPQEIFNRKTPKILKAPVGNNSGKSKYKLFDYVCAFDIETTLLENIHQSVMYIWQFQIENVTVYGRTWEEFNNLLSILKKWKATTKARYVCFIHNLSYEFQFLKSVLDGNIEVVATEKRKILKFIYDGFIEFRCSYRQTNRSLDKFLNDMNVENKKLHDFDYSKKRFWFTELTEDELQYCFNDVIGLVQAIKKEMDAYGDTLYTIPLTSTGYVRRDVKQAIRKVPHIYMKEIQPEYEVFKVLRHAFRGGNTHANRYYQGEILENVFSYDRSSSYPDVIVNYEFPVKPFKKTENSISNLKWLLQRNKPIIGYFEFKNISLKNIYWGCPYIALAKALKIRNFVNDNGRILNAEFIVLALTDIDLKIIIEEYKFDEIRIGNLFYSTYGALPKEITDLVIKYYVDKTILKGDTERELDYMLSKNKLNSIYGMMVQNPAKPEFILTENKIIEKDFSKDEETLLAKYEKQCFLPYQWGVWVTAWARWALEEALKVAGDNFVYCDTDSVKSLCELDLNDFNTKSKNNSERSGACALDKNNIRHYMGIYESEGCYSKFKTLGAKKYCYEQSGKLHLTLSGVNKNGVEELKTIDNFKDGFLFSKNSGLCARYNDFPEITKIEVDGHILEITSNVALEKTTYLINTTLDYQDVINNAKKILENLKEKGVIKR